MPLSQSPEWASEDPPRSHRATSRADHQPHWLPRPGLSVQGSLLLPVPSGLSSLWGQKPRPHTSSSPPCRVLGALLSLLPL